MSLFEKPSTTVQEQINTLSARGLGIPDTVRAEHYLNNISYYRLSAYTRVFYKANKPDHEFLESTTFEQVLNLYVFDRELRLLLLDAIERIEVSLRAQLANTLAEHGPHGYLNASVFDSRYNHQWLLDTLSHVKKGKNAETFLTHYQKKYLSAPPQPPIWMAVECLTFSEVSILFSNLRHAADTQRIEKFYGVKFGVLKSWFRSLSDLRNVCAHHARVWNREFGSFPEAPKKAPPLWSAPPEYLPSSSIRPQRRLYMQVLVIASLMQVVCPESKWTSRLIDLLDRYPAIPLANMGFPANWRSLAIWQQGVQS